MHYKSLKGRIALGSIGLLMLIASTMTAAQPTGPVMIDDGEDKYEGECFDGGICIVPGHPVELEEFQTLDWYEMVLDWQKTASFYKDVGQVRVETCPESPTGVCVLNVGSLVQGSSQFDADCMWSVGDQTWTGEIEVNGEIDGCKDPEFTTTLLGSGVCKYEATMENDKSSYAFTLRVEGTFQSLCGLE